MTDDTIGVLPPTVPIELSYIIAGSQNVPNTPMFSRLTAVAITADMPLFPVGAENGGDGFRLSMTADWELEAADNPAAECCRWLVNESDYVLTIKHDTGVDPLTRFALPANTDFELHPNTAVTMTYSKIRGRWLIF